jgi:hypothetical protein
MKKFDLRSIMEKAWEIYRKYSGLNFGECLRRAWKAVKAQPINSARIKLAAYEAGVTEEVNTWYGWKQLGYMVAHGSKALFGVDLIYASKGDGEIYRASFFGASQVQPVADI